MDMYQIVNLFFICIAMFFGGLSLSLLSPFYPHEALKKGVSVSESGVVVSAIFITTVLSTPLCGRYIHKLGAKQMLGLGAIVCGIGNILFGMLGYLQERSIFFGLSVVTRIFTAVGEAAITSAAYPLAAMQVTQAHEGKAMAVAESCFGIGTMLGASVGGLLYDVAGFSVPFYVCGGILLGSTALSSLFYNDRTKSAAQLGVDRVVTWKELVKCPGILTGVFGLIMAGSARSWYAASLEPFLNDKFAMNPAQCGLVFMGPGFTYTVFTPLFGYLIDRGLGSLKVMILGNIILMLAFLFMGPIPQLSFIGTHLSVTISSISIQGIGTAGIFLGSLLLMMNGTSLAGLPGSEQVKGMVSSLWLLGVCLGSYLGTTLGSITYDSIGFEASTLVESLAMAATIGVLIGVFVSQRLTISWNSDQDQLFTVLEEEDEDTVGDRRISRHRDEEAARLG